MREGSWARTLPGEGGGASGGAGVREGSRTRRLRGHGAGGGIGMCARVITPAMMAGGDRLMPGGGGGHGTRKPPLLACDIMFEAVAHGEG